MCKDHGGSHKDIFYYFKLHNGDLVERSEYHEICNSKTNPLLAWIPYEQIQKRYASELNPKEVCLCVHINTVSYKSLITFYF